MYSSLLYPIVPSVPERIDYGCEKLSFHVIRGVSVPPDACLPLTSSNASSMIYVKDQELESSQSRDPEVKVG